MFTGIVQGKFKVVEFNLKTESARLAVELSPELISNLKLGASVAINGVCLTVAEINQKIIFFDLIEETLKLTNLRNLKVNDLVNVERSLKFGDEIGGHLLSGHIDTTVEILEIFKTSENYIIKILFCEKFSDFILAKGYVGLNGASLTVNNLDHKNNTFEVSLIPETLRLTNLDSCLVGDRLNLEIDRQTQTIVETVKRFLLKNTYDS